MSLSYNDFQKVGLFLSTPFTTVTTTYNSVVTNILHKEFFIINPGNLGTFNIDPNIPILNISNHTELQFLIDAGKIKNPIWNKPQFLINARNKVMFHHCFPEGTPYIPKTVFSREDAKSKLQFPIIAKIADGKGGMGVSKFKTPEELDASTEEFALFSEKINIQHEYRLVLLNGKTVYLGERIPNDDKSKFLREAEDVKTTDRSHYKWVQIDIKNGARIPVWYSKAVEIGQDVQNKIGLEYTGVDIALDDAGKLWVIEANSAPGLCHNQSVELYRVAFENFYGRSLSSFTEKQLQMAEIEINVAQKRLDDEGIQFQEIHWPGEIESSGEILKSLTECLLVGGVYGEDGWVIAKNRDRAIKPRIEVVHEIEDGIERIYLHDLDGGWIEGMNEYGICVQNTRFSENKEQLRDRSEWYKPWIQKVNTKKTGEKADIIEDILECKTLYEALEEALEENLLGITLLADANHLIELEITSEDKKWRVIDSLVGTPIVRTNHGILTNGGYEEMEGSTERAQSEIRKIDAERMLIGVTDTETLIKKLSTQLYEPESPLNVYRNANGHYTTSTVLMIPSKLEFIMVTRDENSKFLGYIDKIGDGKKIKYIEC